MRTSYLSQSLLESELRELSAGFALAVPVSSTLGFLSLPLHWVSFTFSFHRVSCCQGGLLLGLVSASLGPSGGCFSQVPSETLHQICPESVQVPWLCLARAKVWYCGPVLQLGYSSEFYSTSKGKYTLESWRWPSPKGEASLSLGFLHLYFVYSSLSLPYVNWASLEGCLLYLRFSLWFSDFLLFHFYGFFFPFFAFYPLPFWTLFSYSDYLTFGSLIFFFLMNLAECLSIFYSFRKPFIGFMNLFCCFSFHFCFIYLFSGLYYFLHYVDSGFCLFFFI